MRLKSFPIQMVCVKMEGMQSKTNMVDVEGAQSYLKDAEIHKNTGLQGERHFCFKHMQKII